MVCGQAPPRDGHSPALCPPPAGLVLASPAAYSPTRPFPLPRRAWPVPARTPAHQPQLLSTLSFRWEGLLFAPVFLIPSQPDVPHHWRPSPVTDTAPYPEANLELIHIPCNWHAPPPSTPQPEVTPGPCFRGKISGPTNPWGLSCRRQPPPLVFWQGSYRACRPGGAAWHVVCEVHLNERSWGKIR